MLRKCTLSFVLAFALILSACTPSATPTTVAVATETPLAATNSVVETLAPTQEPTDIPLFPITVTDGMGREVTLDAAPEHVISLSPSNTEILFAVGAGDLVVGDTEYCDYPPEAAELTKVGGYSADSISIETILSLEPDLVLADASGHEAVIESLEQANVKVFAVDATSFEEVYGNIETVGKLTGHGEEATALVEDMETRTAAVLDKVATIPEEDRVTVFWEIWDEPLMTAGPNTFIGQMIQMAGGINIFADLAEDYPQVSAEEVVESNPAFILGPDSHGDKLIAEQLAARPGWDQIDAVKNNNIYLIDGNISSRPGPRIVDALEAIAEALYPDLFK